MVGPESSGLLLVTVKHTKHAIGYRLGLGRLGATISSHLKEHNIITNSHLQRDRFMTFAGLPTPKPFQWVREYGHILGVQQLSVPEGSAGLLVLHL